MTADNVRHSPVHEGMQTHSQESRPSANADSPSPGPSTRVEGEQQQSSTSNGAEASGTENGERPESSTTDEEASRKSWATTDNDEEEDHLLSHDPTPFHNPYPMPKWFSVKAVRERELGRVCIPKHQKVRKTYAKFNPLAFRKHAYSSLYFFQKMELAEKLEEHNGCVNCLNFNSTGDLLCSGSDDLQIAIWDWQRSHLRHKYHSGHTSNVFQCKFCLDGNYIISCARDGQVRLCDVRNETLTLSKKLAQHRAPAHKLTLTSPQVVLSCGEDATIYEIDMRMDKHSRILLVKEGDKKVPLYSINSCLYFNPWQFVACGRNPYVYVYDRRFLTTAQESPAPLEKMCPPHLKTSKHNVTCAVFDSIGKSVLASYNDEDLYVFDVRNGELEHTYKGHRNCQTVKGCAWFTDNFILSGSDDGYVYGWDRESEHIVMSLYADENGVVNCLESHPTCPFLATSGLDDNIKIWLPSSYQWPQTMKGIKQRVCTNVRERKIDQRQAAESDDMDNVDSSMIWFIIRQLRQRQRSGRDVAADSSDDDDEDGEREEAQNCIPS